MSPMRLLRLWIPITLSLSAGVSGCIKKETAVWVDVRRAASALSVSEPQQISVDGISAAEAGVLAVIGGFSPSVKGRELRQERREEALETIQAQRASTLQDLTEAYAADLRARAATEIATLGANIAEARRGRAGLAVEAISLLVGAKADERGRIVARLALLAGWPDSGGSRFVPIARTSVVEPLWKAEASLMRDELAELDKQVEAQIDAVLERYEARYTAEKEDLAEAAKAKYRMAAEEAERRAFARMSSTERQSLPRLLTESMAPLPDIGATSLTIPAAQAAAQAPRSPAALPEPLEAITARLNIWLRVRGYKLAAGPTLAPDKTGEFIAWSRRP